MNSKFEKVMLLLTLAGALLSFYLYYTDVVNVPAICPNDGCIKVAQSEYSRFFGIPVSLWGLLYYLAFAMLIMLKEKFLKYYDLLLKLFLLVGIVFTVYLRYLEFFVIKAICVWCWGSVVVVVLLVITYILSQKKNKVDENTLETTN